MTKTTETSMPAPLSCEAGYDPIEDRLRQNVRATIDPESADWSESSEAARPSYLRRKIEQGKRFRGDDG